MPLLEIKNLITYYDTFKGSIRAVNDISFEVNKGEVLGLAGESACGKSTTALSILRLLPPNGKVLSGKILFDGKDIIRMSEKEYREKIRWKKISTVFQGALTSLNPVFRVGDQIVEAIRTHEDVSRAEAIERSENLLDMVGIEASRFKSYPHELSGGMKQRVMIAMALVCNPDLVIADEPVTALDVIVQAQLMQLIRELQQKLNLSMVIITHDLSVIAELCKKCTIMYGGKIMEYADTMSIFKSKHPYTSRLIKAFPDIISSKTRLQYIPGRPPNLLNPPTGCGFHPRCPDAKEICMKEEPLLKITNGGGLAACHLLGQTG